MSSLTFTDFKPSPAEVHPTCLFYASVTVFFWLSHSNLGPIFDCDKLNADTLLCTIINYFPQQWPQIAQRLGREQDDTFRLEQIHRQQPSSCNNFILQSESCVFTHHMKVFSRQNSGSHPWFFSCFASLLLLSTYVLCFQCSRIVSLYVSSKFSSARLIWKSNVSLHFSYHTSSAARWLKTLNQASATVQQSEITGQEYGSSHALSKCHQMHINERDLTFTVDVKTILVLSFIWCYHNRSRKEWKEDLTGMWHEKIWHFKIM